jgi:hypothetical protein
VTYDPLADLASRYPDWVVGFTALGWGIQEALSLRSKVILIEAGDPPAERRCSLAHAVAHLDLGHRAVAAGFFDARQELGASELAARRLIPLEALASALSWTRNPAEIASELLVDRPTLSLRWSRLARHELAYLQRQAGGRVEAA